MPIERTASPTDLPCERKTSTWRSFATISSGLCFFWGIPMSSLTANSLIQGVPLFRGQTITARDQLYRDRRALRYDLADARPCYAAQGDAAGVEVRSLPGRHSVSMADR